MSEVQVMLQILEKKMPVLQEKFRVRDIGIFGSYVRGQQTKRSDVDVLVEFQEPVTFFDFLDLESYLRRLLKKKVDLVTKKALKPRIGKRILREVLYA